MQDERVIITGAPRIERDIEYALRDGQSLQLDAFLPPKDGSGRPAVIIVHGGRWSQLDKRLCAPEAAAFALDGFVAFPINYRMLNGQIALPSQIENVRSAIRWVRQHAERFGVDAARIALFGGSAGGHLSALAAVHRDPLDPESRIKAVAPWSGFYDLLAGHQRMASMFEVTPLEIALGGKPEEVPGKYEHFSPVNHVTADAPPMLIAGSTNEVSPLPDAEVFVKRLRDAGVECEFIVLEGNAHMREYAPLVWDATVRFLKGRV